MNAPKLHETSRLRSTRKSHRTKLSRNGKRENFRNENGGPAIDESHINSSRSSCTLTHTYLHAERRKGNRTSWWNENERRKAREFLFAIVCFDFKRKQTNRIGFRSFVHLSIAFVRLLPMLLLFYFLIGNELRAKRVLNFNKYVHFDSFASTRVVCSFVCSHCFFFV